MKLLMLTRYGRQGASSRMRSFQYLPWLEANGVETTVAPLLSDVYVKGLQQGRKSWREALAAYPQRVRTLLDSRCFDLVWIEQEALPWLPAGIELSLMSRETPFVLDYDDAVFHYYDQHQHSWVKWLLASKHPILMHRAALVVAGNAYLAAHASASGARRVELLPTVVDLERYQPASASAGAADDSKPTVGWIGQRSTAGFLQPLAPVFERLRCEGLVQFRAIGIDASALGLPMDSEAWSESTEVAAIQRLDVGIMPLVDGPFERGKCGYKLIQYMACGLPVVASPVGVNATIVEHGVNGFLASTVEEWEQALRTLAIDPALRQRMGQAGRAKVEREFCLQVAGPQLAGWLQETASGKGA